MKKILLVLAAALILVSCGWTNKDIINPDAEYLYFYGATCPHCTELNTQIKTAWILEELSIEKREVWYNNENQALFQEVVTELWLDESKVWVPFVLEKSIENTLQNFELSSKSSIKLDIIKAIKDYMVVSIDECICDYIPQIVTTAIATIITGELTKLICIQEHYNIKVDNLKWSEDQITS